ncbi:hypothetical protein [Bradyrhizobium sp. SRS-191]
MPFNRQSGTYVDEGVTLEARRWPIRSARRLRC